MKDLPRIEISSALVKGIKAALSKKDAVFTFESDPQLASLVSAMGLCFEINQSDWNRLGPPLGFGTRIQTTAPWQARVVEVDGFAGVEGWVDGVELFYPDHPDFGYILHSASLNSSGELARVILSPYRISQFMKSRGVEAVVVKEWVLSSFLADESERENYQVTNLKELEANIALLQTKLMLGKQLSLTGTHDLVDHVLGLDVNAFDRRSGLIQDARELLGTLEKSPHKRALSVSYLMGVVLDDMAQPVWYLSEKHDFLLQRSISLLTAAFSQDDWLDWRLPPVFTKLVSELRSDGEMEALVEVFNDFEAQVLGSEAVSMVV